MCISISFCLVCEYQFVLLIGTPQALVVSSPWVLFKISQLFGSVGESAGSHDSWVKGGGSRTEWSKQDMDAIRTSPLFIVTPND